jgi:hypothetical protein
MIGQVWLRAVQDTVAAFVSAAEATRAVLLHQSQLILWIPVGLVAFLDQVGESNIQFASRLATGQAAPWEQQWAWVDPGDLLTTWVEAAAESPHALVGSVLGTLLLVLLAMILITGVGSIGQLMFVRLVATRRPVVLAHARGAWPLVRSLWAFRLALFAVSFILFIPFFITGMLWMAQAGGQGVESWSQLVRIVAPLAAVWSVVGSIFLAINSYTRHIVVPIMNRRDCDCLEAWAEGLDLLRLHFRPLLLFFTARLILLAAFLSISSAISIVLCCIGFYPIVHHILFVPYYFFDRAFGVDLLARLDATLAHPGPEGGEA